MAKKSENRSSSMNIFSNRFGNEAGFTFIELVMVVTMIGLLTSIAAERLSDAGRQAELTAEVTIVDMMRSNLITNFADDLIKGVPAKFPEDPFSNMYKVPDGFDRRRSSQPSGEDRDEDLWVFVPGGGGTSPENSGTTLPGFQPTGTIFHQRKDGTVVKWAYDANMGVISKRI